jgi:hypothetical protein
MATRSHVPCHLLNLVLESLKLCVTRSLACQRPWASLLYLQEVASVLLVILCVRIHDQAREASEGHLSLYAKV